MCSFLSDIYLNIDIEYNDDNFNCYKAEEAGISVRNNFKIKIG